MTFWLLYAPNQRFPASTGRLVLGKTEEEILLPARARSERVVHNFPCADGARRRKASVLAKIWPKAVAVCGRL